MGALVLAMDGSVKEATIVQKAAIKNTGRPMPPAAAPVLE
jgi:hypothetical protein